MYFSKFIEEHLHKIVYRHIPHKSNTTGFFLEKRPDIKVSFFPFWNINLYDELKVNIFVSTIFQAKTNILSGNSLASKKVFFALGFSLNCIHNENM